MEIKNLQAAILAVNEINSESLSESAIRAKIPVSTLHKVIMGKISAAGTIRKLCQGLAKDEAQARQIVQAYILDEIERAGMSGRAGISLTPEFADETLIRNLATIAAKSDEIREVLRFLFSLYPGQERTFELGAIETHHGLGLPGNAIKRPTAKPAKAHAGTDKDPKGSKAKKALSDAST